MKRGWRAVVALALLSNAPVAEPDDALIQGDTLPQRLSEFRLMLGRQGETPNARVVPYALRNALFSDYAEKFRYAYIPKGSKIGWRDAGVLDFPVGSVLIKSFGYPADMRAPAKDVRMIETRLLIRRASGWVALPYVWNADGTDATLKRAGARVDVSWTHLDGNTRTISYAVPNVNQCKDCHALDNVLTPIGPKARNLDAQLFNAGNIAGAPMQRMTLPVWNDASSGSLESRARAYLDVNCGHCHNPRGAASNSGLNLVWEERNPIAIGIGKRPVAAGRGGGDHAFDIAAGRPQDSILVHRLRSIDPGVAMPELGRATVHEEGVALLEAWIAGIPPA